MGVSVTTDPFRAIANPAVFGRVILTIAILFLETPWPQTVTAANADIVPGVELHGNRSQAIDCVGLVGQPGPPRLSTNVILCPSIGNRQSQRDCDPRASHRGPCRPSSRGVY